MEEALNQLTNEIKLLVQEVKDLKGVVGTLQADFAQSQEPKAELDSVTVAQAAKMLDVSGSMVRKLMKAKKLDYYKDEHFLTRILISSLKNI